ncbi:exostosin domain-containing protein [Mucilaginibacter lacusdianchii]|uniref:exostosin domain-containing protein n=1 Tax=Mucilaginibacter lacusdianchii TaxID=2684211 RepID=UPI00131BA579|nr:exostosin family protein [Mucilaginibacter sp. JXJ CY 39]
MDIPKFEQHATKVFITSAYGDPEPISSFLKIAAQDKIQQYQIVGDPEEATIILFIENSRYHSDYFYRKLKNNSLVKKYPEKVYMYNPHDKPWLVLPGLYASMPKQFFNKAFMAAVPYIESINPYITYQKFTEFKYLFSFLGSPNSPPRRKILQLHHDQAFLKPSLNNMFGSADLKDVKLQYAELLSSSKFVLCPRGAGTSSFRIFETMQAGRVPVIISDNWVAPNGPAWESFAIFVPESDVELIPEILKAEEVVWEIKSQKSREAWETFFAPDVIFNYMISNLLMLEKSHANSDLLIHVFHTIPYLKYVFRALCIQNVKRILKHTKDLILNRKQVTKLKELA